MKPIVVFGSINMDLVSRTNRIPRPGETIIGSSFEMHSGGKGANQAVAVARLGHPSILLGAIGDDVFGRQLLETLKGFGVDISHIRSVQQNSGVASIVVDAAGENSILVVPGANLAVTPEYLETKLDLIQEAALVLAQLEIPLESIAWLAETCSRYGIPFMLDPAPAAELPDAVLRKVTWFTPNQTEASFYAPNCETAEESVTRLFDRGIANVILKRSSEGALVATQDGSREWIPAFSVTAIDTTAAGDAFNGAFATSLARGSSVKDAARFASAAAAISVTRRGAQPSLADEQEVTELLRSRNEVS